MIELTDAQVLAAATRDRLVNVVAAPGSGKTTIAAERYGFLRYQSGDPRGVLGLTFNRAAAAELRRRVSLRWGASCVRPAHRVITFDSLHVDLLTYLIRKGKVKWPSGTSSLDVRDDYHGMKGYRFLKAGNYVRFANLDANHVIFSDSRQVTQPESGIGNVAHHNAVINDHVLSHADVRSILSAAMRVNEMRLALTKWLADNYRAMIVDEVYDADYLDLYVTFLAAEGGLSVTLIGDPRQALYKWRGATPEIVEGLLHHTSERFVPYEQLDSFRFRGEQMPHLAKKLRESVGASLPPAASSGVDVALARNWRQLWTVGDNVLPLAFKTVNNATDAAMNLLLDVVTRARLGMTSYGRDTAITKLGLEREYFQAQQDAMLEPLIAKLHAGADESQVLEDLRETIKHMGVRKPSQLKPENEAAIRRQLAQLAARLKQTTVVPGLTVFQAKGREWDRVGVALTKPQLAALTSGLQPLEEEHCIIYVAITRAKYFCGLLSDTSGFDADQLPLDPYDQHDTK